MAVDKLVDSTQLNSDLTSVANAIRAKSGGSSQLAFPGGFVSEIGNIPSGGGGYSAEEVAQSSGMTGVIEFTSDITSPRYAAFRDATNITAVVSKHEVYFSTQMFYGCTSLQKVCWPQATHPSNSGDLFRGSSALQIVDWGKRNVSCAADSFRDCNSLSVIILRKTESIATLSNSNCFRNCTPIQSGGSGVTIYIPKAFYDALGTGTNDYKAATNWSTLDGYGTITWAKLEGSIYESETWWED